MLLAGCDVELDITAARYALDQIKDLPVEIRILFEPISHEVLRIAVISNLRENLGKRLREIAFAVMHSAISERCDLSQPTCDDVVRLDAVFRTADDSDIRGAALHIAGPHLPERFSVFPS